MEYTINNILVPTDFSKAANNALKVAVAMANRHKATLHLVHFIPPSSFSAPPESAVGHFGIETMLVESASENLEKDRNQIVNKNQLLVTTYCNIGTVSVSVNSYVKGNKIDMVVMGTHGSSGIKEFLIGSNAMAVIKETNVPVLTIPPTFLKTTFDKILYPVRMVDGVEEKYDYIKPIIAKNDSVVHILGVENEDIDTTKTCELTEFVEKVKEVILHDQSYVSSEIQLTENIASKILEIAQSKESDMLIINATLDHQWFRIFSSSFTQQIVNHANIPVLSIKPILTEKVADLIKSHIHQDINKYTPPPL